MQLTRISAAAAAAALPLLARAAFTGTQESLAEAVAGYSELSIFTGILAVPNILGTLVDSSVDGNVTILIPTDAAIGAFIADQGVASLAEIDDVLLQAVLKYHILDAGVTGEDLAETGGVTVPTLLKEELYNNRTSGPEIQAMYGEGATGQVVFAQAGLESLRKRQLVGPEVGIRGGGGETGGITAIDGEWDGGYFHAVDIVIPPPVPCSTTIRGQGETLQSLDNALNRTGLYPILDTLFNVTCLAPVSEAFGGVDETLEVELLTQALAYHTLTQPTYSTFLEDGMELTSVNNLTVKVTISESGQISFNGAKVLQANVLTNNGLIHILESVMPPPNATAPPPSSTSVAPSSSSVAPTTSASVTPDAAVSLTGTGLATSVLAFVAAAVALAF